MVPYKTRRRGIQLDKQPIITNDLIEYFDRIYPDVAPELNITDREVWFKRGSVDVVRHMKRLLADQQDNILDI